MRTLLATLILTSVASFAFGATQTIDGVNINLATWGVSAVAVQDTNTQFGDTTAESSGNELDQMFIDWDAENIYIGLTGNLADNNGLTLFIDTDVTAGNHPVITEPGTGIPCVGVYPRLLRYMNGATFSDPNLPAVFTPDYGMIISVGKFPGQSDDELVMACDLVDLNVSPLEDGVTVLGIGVVGTGNGLLTSNTGAEVALDNSNYDGVGVWSYDPNAIPPIDNRFPIPPDEDPTEPTSGFEIKLPRYLLGLDDSMPHAVSFFAYISDNAQNGDAPEIVGVCDRRAWGSNQALPGLNGWGNLSQLNGKLPPDPDSRILDLSGNLGNNYVTVTVTP